MNDVRTIDQMDWVQQAIFAGLLSCDLFAPLTVVMEKKLRQDSQVEIDSIWQTPRHGRTGAGAMVEMPKLLSPKPNSQVNELQIGVVIFEERNMNLVPGTGTELSAESWAQLVTEFLRGWIIGQAGGLTPEPNAITLADDWMKEGEGVMALRASVSMRISRPNYTRCPRPEFALVGSEVTLTAVSGAEIYFTTDGTFPGHPDEVKDSTAQLYTGPFTVSAGDLVQFIALKTGQLPSHVGAQTIS